VRERIANLARDLALAHARGVETGRDDEQVLRRALPVPRAHHMLGFTRVRFTPGERGEQSAPAAVERKGVARGERDLHAAARRDVDEFLDARLLAQRRKSLGARLAR